QPVGSLWFPPFSPFGLFLRRRTRNIPSGGQQTAFPQRQANRGESQWIEVQFDSWLNTSRWCFAKTTQGKAASRTRWLSLRMVSETIIKVGAIKIRFIP